jgi:endonuclease/exonuclease/phosphatase family metal-dependent hydrolase
MVLGAQIDHVMSTSSWKTVSMKVIGTEDGSGSDHRPIVATLAPSH